MGCSEERNRKSKTKNDTQIINTSISDKINEIPTKNDSIQPQNKNEILSQRSGNNSIENMNKILSSEISKNQNEKKLFPPGEYYYDLIRDINIISPALLKEKKEKKKKSLSERIQVFFTLKNVYNSNNQHSFKISIINNKKINNETFLGDLEESIEGDNIIYGKSFEIDYFFEKEQIINIDPIINGKKFGERIQFVLCKLISSKDNKISLEIKDIGTLIINYSKKNMDSELKKEISIFQFSITLTNDIFKTQKYLENIFYVIRNIKDKKTKRPVYKSHEYDFEFNKKKQLALISLDTDILCDNDNGNIFFELYSPSIDEDTFIGCTSFTINQLKSALIEDKEELIDIESDDYGKLGILKINYNYTKKMSFEQFVKKGQINLEIAIDYTQSNGDPRKPDSLHYMNGEKRNDYEEAIKSCGDIIAYYDSDELFPVYGFGGIPKGSKEVVSHCFNINFNKDNPNIQGIDNVLKIYKESLKKIEFYAPTYFSPIIEKVVGKIKDDLKNRSEKSNYYFLMILTDGMINDYKETIDNIVDASNLPLSIVIIGVGDKDFENMNNLDGDEEPLTNSHGELRKRDIVQFVEFNQYKNSGTDLSEEVLKEIPRQVEEYYQICGKFYE